MWHRRRMPRLAVIALAICGCRGESAERTAPATAPAPVARDAGAAEIKPGPIITAPHSGQIAVVAVGDRGDVAFTADDNGELRFWPSLDGKREPVAMGTQLPTDLAIAREHDGFVAALLDTADGITLLRFTADGALRSREVLASEPGNEELIAGDGFVLARRNDHTIARVDANVKQAPPLAPQMGEQVLAIAARRATAVAGIADRERTTEIRYIRTIELAKLAWGKQVELPVPLAAPIALSPSGKRVAGLHARTGAGVIVELVPVPRVIANDVVGTDPAENVIGFLDDNHVVFRGGVMVEVEQGQRPAVDPWASVRTKSRARLGRGAVVADRAVYGGASTHLVIADGSEAKFLGYRDLGLGFLRVTGEQITLGFGNRILWLDDKLALKGAYDVANDAAGGIAVDDTHLLKATYSYLEDNRSKLDLSLFDATTSQENPLVSYPGSSTITYDPRSSVIAAHGYTSLIPRGYYDRATNHVTAQRELKTRLGDPDEAVTLVSLELLDPKLANGAVAVTQMVVGTRTVIETYVDDGKSHRPIKPATTVRLRDIVSPVGITETGAVFTLASTPDPAQQKPLFVHEGGKEVKRFMVDGSAVGGTVDRTGGAIALYSNAQVILYADGKERWRAPLWSVNMAKFTNDGKTLLVNTQGGLAAFDTATGTRRATGCGWGFGLSSAEPPLTIFVAPVVCGEPP